MAHENGQIPSLMLLPIDDDKLAGNWLSADPRILRSQGYTPDVEIVDIRYSRVAGVSDHLDGP